MPYKTLSRSRTTCCLRWPRNDFVNVTTSFLANEFLSKSPISIVNFVRSRYRNKAHARLKSHNTHVNTLRPSRSPFCSVSHKLFIFLYIKSSSHFHVCLYTGCLLLMRLIPTMALMMDDGVDRRKTITSACFFFLDFFVSQILKWNMRFFPYLWRCSTSEV